MSEQQDHQEEEEEEEVSLPKLLAALGMGARAVQTLPLEDEFDYQSSFPEFSSLVVQNSQHLVEVLSMVDPSLLGKDIQDPQLWETCADICDSLVEQAEAHTSTTSTQNLLEELSVQTRFQAQGSYGRMMQGLVEMEKPQVTYGIHVQNDRLEPFRPKAHPSKPFSISGPLDLTLEKGHGLERRFSGRCKRAVSPTIVAPSHHAPHVYQKEIESFQDLQWLLQAPTEKPPAIIPTPTTLEATWIDTKQGLANLSKKLECVDMVAIDLEAHSHHSFSGMVCLMQLTIKDQDHGEMDNYLVDTLKLWNIINSYLAPMFANPAIVKVMHGADSDIQWLQRDFGIYVVNLFDTGLAARRLKLDSAGLAYLLKHYVKVSTDKSHQLADWRQRPLPKEMQQYAIMDTHYLLDIFPHLQYDLSQNKDTSIQDVLDDSRQVCLIRYDKEPFDPYGYQRILVGRKRRTKKETKSELSPLQERVLKSLWDWRDAVARSSDESLFSVCSEQALLRLSMACPTTVTALQSLMNPMPPMLLRYSPQLLDRIKQCFDAEETGDVLTESKNESAFFKPAPEDEDREEQPRGILSPVLGTEEMYQQAGWLTPQVMGEGKEGEEEGTEVVTTTTDDDDFEQEGTKPRKFLMVDAANKEYSTNQYTAHSLELRSQQGNNRGRTADGLGPARAAKGGETPALEEKARLAKLTALRIRNGMTQEEDLLGLVSPTNEFETGASGDLDEDEPEKENDDAASEEDFQIPKSMREIYRISNRNRRNRNIPSPPNAERSAMMAETMAVDSLEGAETVLEASGYYANIKKQRTKSDESGDTEASARPSREDDIEFMKQIGWIESKEQLDAFEGPSQGDGDDNETMGDDRETPTDGESKSSSIAAKSTTKAPSPFDYASVGPIGVYNPNAPPPSNPFFAGAAAAGAPAAQNYPRRRSNTDRNKGGGRGSRNGSGRQGERPEKKDGRSYVYKKR